jgi:hypothetical protein
MNSPLVLCAVSSEEVIDRDVIFGPNLQMTQLLCAEPSNAFALDLALSVWAQRSFEGRSIRKLLQDVVDDHIGRRCGGY